MSSWNKRCMAGTMMFGLAAMPACSDEVNPEDFRCIIEQRDGSCVSVPAGCLTPQPMDHTVTALAAAPDVDKPSCANDETLVPIADDHCAHKLICVDTPPGSR